MKFPIQSRPVPWRQTPYFNMMYLAAPGHGGPDPTIVWTSEVEFGTLQRFITLRNQSSHKLVSTSHVLAKAVGVALAKHPELNRRVIGRRVYQYKNCNVCLATRVPNQDDVKVIQIHDADMRTIDQIAYIVFKRQLGMLRKDSPECKDLARFRRLPGFFVGTAIRTINWLDRRFRLPVFSRLDRLRESCVLINDYSHPRFPVMRGYKPSRHPSESKPLSVTLGKPEEKVVWVKQQPAMRLVAPLSVRVDHRIADGFQLGQFIKTVGEYLSHPEQLESPTEQTEPTKPIEPPQESKSALMPPNSIPRAA